MSALSPSALERSTLLEGKEEIDDQLALLLKCSFTLLSDQFSGHFHIPKINLSEICDTVPLTRLELLLVRVITGQYNPRYVKAV